MHSTFLILFSLSMLLLAVSGQGSGTGGGTCYESRGRTEACPTYNYTRYGSEGDYYEHRFYDATFWYVENSNATILPSEYAHPIEGVFATYRPLEEYFFGQNDKKLNISRETAPGVIAFAEVARGQFAYTGGIALPPLSSYPPPNPTNTSIQVNGGMAFDAYVKIFSNDHSPSNEEIVIAADRFARQLTNDTVKFQNISLAAFYEPIGAPGNWTKEIWFFPPMSPMAAQFKFPAVTTHTSRKAHN